MNRSRRIVLTAVAATGIASTAGCLRGLPGEVWGDSGADGSDAEADSESTDTSGDTPAGEPTEGESDPNEGSEPPVAERPRYLGYTIEHLSGEEVNGGVPKDGIPSIDDPSFVSVSDAELTDGEPVFGVVKNGIARAYPQYVLVWHEIVNDEFDGDPVAVTYCPLTGTAQGFERGGAEFGVSGNLVNSNLVMYDRATDTRWPQMLATGIRGPLAGESLREFRVIWTAWERWRNAYPDSQVLSERTGFARRYGNDPYGNYDPDSGYYTSTGLIFSPLAEDDRVHPKRVVLGARTKDGAIAFDKPTLLEEHVLTGSIDADRFVAVADPELETGYVYWVDGTDPHIEPQNGSYRIGTDKYHPSALPFKRVLAFDAMWFAWFGFYPETTFVER